MPRTGYSTPPNAVGTGQEIFLCPGQATAHHLKQWVPDKRFFCAPDRLWGPAHHLTQWVPDKRYFCAPDRLWGPAHHLTQWVPDKRFFCAPDRLWGASTPPNAVGTGRLSAVVYRLVSEAAHLHLVLRVCGFVPPPPPSTSSRAWLLIKQKDNFTL